MIFLAGANLGAAVYEFGLARLTRAVLDHRFADWRPFVRYTLQCEGIEAPTDAHGGKRFPSADIDEHDVHAVLARRFQHATVEARRLAEHAAQGYSGIVLAWAR